ncbi:hypothetical protein C8Q75DRAFT_731405 [Abortiporus biennis]|nr:hypothetical protein C8Q75DRAFT_731405 [Abortiporus biennis]
MYAIPRSANNPSNQQGKIACEPNYRWRNRGLYVKMVNMVITNFGKWVHTIYERLWSFLDFELKRRRADDDNNAGSFRQLASSALARLRVILGDDRYLLTALEIRDRWFKKSMRKVVSTHEIHTYGLESSRMRRRKTSQCNEMIVSMEELEFGNIGMKTGNGQNETQRRKYAATCYTKKENYQK